MITADGLVVVHRDGQGRSATCDFAALPAAAPFQRSLARLFAAKCAPSGSWGERQDQQCCVWAIRPFAHFLGGYEGAPQDVDGMTVVFWNAWRLSLAPRPFDHTKHSTVSGPLRQDPRLPGAVREAMSNRFVWVHRG
ncbi:hypothetical protein [Streptomyces sp. NPDC017988]|uniref:hypothetical protein n=1 Tax=Streptomyces sp. NPDC017988 TaxID=3365025 RepID=UPI0037A76F7D